MLLFDTLLTQFRELGLLKSRGKQRTDSTHVLAAIRAFKSLECVGETMRHALNTLAVAAPEFVLAHGQAEWVARCGPRLEDYRLPESQADRDAYAAISGADGRLLLTDARPPSSSRSNTAGYHARAPLAHPLLTPPPLGHLAGTHAEQRAVPYP